MNYVIITPARNEAAFIEKTINSVCSQSKLPLKWVVVSDNSTDRTDEIVSEYAKQYGFIKLLRRENKEERNFGARARAIVIGYNEVRHLDYQFIGNLDADVSFGPDYYGAVLDLLQANPMLGIAGGFIYEERDGVFQSRQFNTERSVAGALQLFRRKCFEDIGGYFPMPYGGPDTVAEVMARMHGWEVRAFPELKVNHYRPTSSAEGPWKSRFRQGLKEYSLGTHPFYLFLKCCRRFSDKNLKFGSLATFAGFLWAYIRWEKRTLPPEFVRYFRKEQMRYIRSIIASKMGIEKYE